MKISHRFFIFIFTKNKTNIMNELIEKLQKEANLTPEQAQKAIETIANFVKEKFPMLGGAVDNIFKAS
jgi:hypothetical protein